MGPPDDWASLPKHAQDWLTSIEHSSVPKPEKKEPPPPPAAILFAAWTPDWEARAFAEAERLASAESGRRKKKKGSSEGGGEGV